MAINIDTVYQRVLALANKEQRGYVTPQEFNLIANQAQQEIFEQYIYDLNQRTRLEPEQPGVRGEEDVETLLNEKLAPFTKISTLIGGVKYPDNYTIGKVFYNNFEAEKLPRNEVVNIQSSSRHSALLARSPVYCDSAIAGQDILVVINTGQATTGVTCEVINKPADVEWDYVVVAQKALYNSAGSTNFELHESEETNIVNKILQLAGIVINKAGLAQTFAQREVNETNIKKQ
jgi:hypothetical protein